ncbi:MAG: 30S ribosomal protein S1, partial [Thermanaerothrix sp.]|nr:30S ribosomal protein S1 [Thermanaerothrix sp.]
MDYHETSSEQGVFPENHASENNNMASLLEQSLGIDFPKRGEIREGVIASINPEQKQILVSVGTKSEGVISGREFEQIPHDELARLEVGQRIPVY